MPAGATDWKSSSDMERIKHSIGNIFPKSLSKYFLFDAELLDTFFNTSEGVKEGIEKITGLPIIEKAIKDLDKTAIHIRSSIKDVNLAPINNSIQHLERKKENLTKKIDDEITKIQSYDEKIKDIESFLRNNNEELVKSTQQRIDGLKKDIEDIKKDLKKHNKDMNNWILQSNIRTRLYRAMKTSLDKCNVWEEKGKIPIAVSGLALKNILKANPSICICGAHLDAGSKERKHIEDMLSEKRIESPIIQNITIGRGYWEDISNSVEQTHKQFQEYRARRDELDTKDHEKYEIKKELEKKIEGVNIPEIQRKSQELSDLRNELQSSISDRDITQRELDKTNHELESENRELSNKLKKSEKHQSDRNRLNLANILERLFQEYRDELADELRYAAAKKTTEYFLKLVSRKKDFAKVEIREDYKTAVLDSNQKTKRLSAGQNCCLALSYIAAIRDISEKNYFMLIDSPLHNISQEERVDIAKNLPQFLPKTQITLLVQDQEYTGEAKKGITGEIITSVRKTLRANGSVWKEYILKNYQEHENSSYTRIEEVKE